MTEIATAEAPLHRGVIAATADRYGMEPVAFERTLRATVFPAEASREHFAAFLLVAKEYDLNPLLKQIYAFPDKRGGVQPIVPIDGWLRIINEHKQYDGMEIEDKFENGKIHATTCKMYRKDRKYPVIITEYFEECVRPTDQWKQKPVRMLHHKAVIQAARYAFGLGGIVEPDEAENIVDMGAATVVPAQTATVKTGEDVMERLKKLQRDIAEPAPTSELPQE